MKKRLTAVSALVLSVTLMACGAQNVDGTQEASKETAQSTAATQETGTETSAGNETTDSTQAETGEGEIQEVTEWSQGMTDLKKAIVETLGENYWPTYMVDPATLEAAFGITSDMYDDYLAEMPMISAHVDTLVVIQAKEDKVDEVEEALEAYREALVNDTLQYPMNVGKIQASRIETIGNYVCFVQLGADITEASESGDEAVITHCQEQNELVIEVIGQTVEH